MPIKLQEMLRLPIRKEPIKLQLLLKGLPLRVMPPSRRPVPKPTKKLMMQLKLLMEPLTKPKMLPTNQRNESGLTI